MKILFSWLKEFVDVPDTPENLADRLTMAGIEASSVEYLGKGFDNLVVARIEKIEKHPNADRLSLCQVWDGERTRPIVCGATNIREGDIVPLALPGAVLPGGIEIRKAKIRGVVSEGMMCSEKELGLSEDHSGIMILPEEAAVGSPVRDALFLDDYLIEVEITPNRGDCLSVLGVAREVSALYGIPLKKPKISFPEEGEDVTKVASVQIKDLDLCPRYSSRVVSGVKIAPSPLWMQQRLRLCGIRPINNVVDVTNYILLELGQPMHAFDLDLLEGAAIVVKRAGERMKFTTLDGMERDIEPDDLLIWDGKRPVALAGIMGGENTEVRETTTRVLFESAHFTPLTIRKTSRRLGLSTESSYRFERGVDPAGTLYAAERAVTLLAGMTDLVVHRGFIDVRERDDFSRSVPLRVERASKIAGLPFTREDAREILSGLGCEVKDGEGGTLSVTVPPHRFDLEREIDLVEELVRIRGYGEVPTTYPSARAPHTSKDHDFFLFREKTAEILSTLGFSECVTFSFMSGKLYETMKKFLPDFEEEPIRIANPISEETQVMRPSLFPGLVKALSHNLSHYERDVRIFEAGKVFSRAMKESLYEEYRVGFILSGDLYPKTHVNRGREVDFLFARSVLENLFSRLGKRETVIAPAKTPPLFEEGESCIIIIDGKTIGYIGKVHSEVLKIFDLERDFYYCEFSLTKLFDVPEKTAKFTPISKYPPVERDLSFVLPYDIPVGDIVEYVKRVHEFVRKVYVFDVFVSEKLGAGKKSVGLRIIFQSDDRTLTDRDVDDIHKTIVK
ncbi:MAG: phenylalanine--tRNA ligase subunit beta, partial [Deltaproteobacteria bacterium]